MSEAANSAQADGIRMLQAGDIPGATAAFQQAVAENPNDGRSRAFLGICHARRGDTSAAIAELEQAVRLLPSDAATRYNLALAYYQARRMDDARRELNETLTLNPEHSGARELLNRVEESGAASAAASPSAPTSTPDGQQWSGGAGTPAEPAAFGGGPGAEPLSWSPAPQAAPAFAPAAASGMAYAPAADAAVFQEAPGLGRRVLRGWAWGMLYGQFWTLWTVISAFIWQQASLNSGFIFVMVVYAILAAFFGSLAGIVIGLADAEESAAAGIGMGAGVLILGLEFLLTRDPPGIFGVVFYLFSGRYIGAGIGGRVQQPVTR